MKKLLYLSTSLIALLLIALMVNASLLYAQCSPDGGSGDDDISCSSDDSDGVDGGDGDDTITVEENVEVDDDIEGGDGNDEITIEEGGSVENEGTAVEGEFGNDTIVNNGEVSSDFGDGIDGGFGNDLIVNNGAVFADDTGLDGGPSFGPGADTMTNNGLIVADVGMDGGGGADVLTNNGFIFSFDEGINGGLGNDYIVNNGIIAAYDEGIVGGWGDDTIVVGPDAVIDPGFHDPAIDAGKGDDFVVVDANSNVMGVINGGHGYDILEFEFSTREGDEYNAAVDFFAEVLANKDPDGGHFYFPVTGEFYKWKNFEELRALLTWLVEQQSGEAEGDTQNICQSPFVQVFHLPGGTFEVYSAYNVNPQGYLIASFDPVGLAFGELFQLPNDPNWFIRVFDLGGGVAQVNVYDASDTLIDDSCAFQLYG